MNYELKDFEQDVIDAARSTPVIIDFWAEWCGPCRQLSPTLEKLADEANGRWKLVKIDTDKNPALAIEFGVRGIPFVKMVYQDEMIAEFTGAQPEHIIRKWLQENLPGNEESGSSELLENVKQLLAKGDRDKAKTLLEKQVSSDSSADLKAKYAMLMLPSDISLARKYLCMVEENKYQIEKGTLQTVEDLSELIKIGESFPGRDTVGELYIEAARDLLDSNFKDALPKFIECLQLERMIDDDGPRKACIACFTMLGEQHPLTMQYRRPFSISLY